jgi:hypothetical protein
MNKKNFFTYNYSIQKINIVHRQLEPPIVNAFLLLHLIGKASDYLNRQIITLATEIIVF